MYFPVPEATNVMQPRSLDCAKIPVYPSQHCMVTIEWQNGATFGTAGKSLAKAMRRRRRKRRS